MEKTALVKSLWMISFIAEILYGIYFYFAFDRSMFCEDIGGSIQNVLDCTGYSIVHLPYLIFSIIFIITSIIMFRAHGRKERI